MASRVVLITGANRGIGLAILQSLIQGAPDNTYCLAARSKVSGAAVIKELREQEVKTKIDVVELDVTAEKSIECAVEQVKNAYGRLDVLVNNAGIALNPKPDGNDFRQVYNRVFDTNVTSVAVLTTRFLPLLKLSDDPRVINISSARASVALQSAGSLPPTASIPYSTSKTALNILTIEMQKLYENILFYVVSPGHCKTAFNGFRGTKDPLDGAKVVVELVTSARNTYRSGFWQYEQDEMSTVQW